MFRVLFVRVRLCCLGESPTNGESFIVIPDCYFSPYWQVSLCNKPKKKKRLERLKTRSSKNKSNQTNKILAVLSLGDSGRKVEERGIICWRGLWIILLRSLSYRNDIVKDKALKGTLSPPLPLKSWCAAGSHTSEVKCGNGSFFVNFTRLCLFLRCVMDSSENCGVSTTRL